MAISVGTATQLSVFDTVKSIFRKSSILNTKFSTDDYYQYEPNYKDATFKGFPYIVITNPSTENDPLVLNRTSKLKDLDVPVDLVVEYSARSNILSYSNAMIDIFEQNNSDMESQGYYNNEIELDNPVMETTDQKRIFRTSFIITCQVNVVR